MDGPINFPFAKPLCGKDLVVTMPRHPRQLDIRPDLLLGRNIRSLLDARGVDDGALAAWCGHKPPWLSKILSGERGLKVKDLGRVADFFGIEVSQLFQYGIDPLLQRRKRQRRIAFDRRQEDRRQSTASASSPETEGVVHGTTPIRIVVDPIRLAEQLTVLAEHLKNAAADILGGHAAALGDISPNSTDSHSTIRRNERQAGPRKTG